MAWMAPWAKLVGFMETLALGIPGFFEPRPGASFNIEQCVPTPETSFYATDPLRKTLERLIDFDCLNDGPVRCFSSSDDQSFGRSFRTVPPRLPQPVGGGSRRASPAQTGDRFMTWNQHEYDANWHNQNAGTHWGSGNNTAYWDSVNRENAARQRAQWQRDDENREAANRRAREAAFNPYPFVPTPTGRPGPYLGGFSEGETVSAPASPPYYKMWWPRRKAWVSGIARELQHRVPGRRGNGRRDSPG